MSINVIAWRVRQMSPNRHNRPEEIQMRNIVLAFAMAWLTLAAGLYQAAALDGFDLGDMPPLPPPLLDDSSNLAPPPSGPLSPLMEGQAGSGAASLAPLAPPPFPASGSAGSGMGGGGALPPAGGFGGASSNNFGLPPGGGYAGVDSSLPPAPPPLAPPPIDSPGFTPLAPPPVGGVTAGSPTSPGQFAPLGQTPTPTAPGQISVPALGTAPGGIQPGSVIPSASGAPEVAVAGRVSGGRVNVRAGPNTQYESIAVLGTGTPVTVVARHGEWYKIAFPADQLASIHKNYVTAEISGEIPEAGVPGVINQDDAPVHAFYWDKSTVVGKLAKGTPVVIKQERGQWYRIVAPATARAFVFEKYVQVDGGGNQVVADAAPPPANPAVDMTAMSTADGKRVLQQKLSDNDKKVAALKESYYKRMQEAHEAEQRAAQADFEARQRQYEAEVERRRAQAKADAESRMLQANQLELALRDLEGRLRAVDSEATMRMTYDNNEMQRQIVAQTQVTTVGAAAWAPPDPVEGGYTGWVENIGRVGYAPSQFRLTKGGEIRFYLISDRANLGEFVNRRVWVNGRVEFAGGASASVLNVEQIRPLTEYEIAEDMRRMGLPPQAAGELSMPPGVVGAFGGPPAPFGAPAPAFVTAPEAYAGGADYDPYAGGTYTPSASPADVYATTPVIGPGPGAVVGATTSYGAGEPTGTADLVTDIGNIYGSTGSYGGGDVYSGGGSFDSTYGTTTTYSDPFGGTTTTTTTTYGDPYGGGTGGFVDAGGASYGGGTSAVPAPMVFPPRYGPAGAGLPGGGVVPADPSQLPDIVSSTSPSFLGGAADYSTSTAPASGFGMNMGEVDTNLYENPGFKEIGPDE